MISNPTPIQLLSTGLEDTNQIAASFVEQLEAGTVVALFGRLGAGKTAFVKACARALGVTEEVTSPSFTIMNIYSSEKVPLYHFDFYRLNRNSNWDELGLDEYLYGDGICFLEWPDRLPQDYLTDAISVAIKFRSPFSEVTANHRILEFSNLKQDIPAWNAFLYPVQSR